jgi:hypothetical protein
MPATPSYIINSSTVQQDTLSVNITCILTDGTRVTVDVPCFQIANVMGVLSALHNRLLSEQAKYNATVLNQTIASTLPIGVQQT